MSIGRIGFTTRASCLLAAGITAILCGILLGVVDLVRAGSIGVAVPVVAAVVVRRSQLTVSSRREIDPARAPSGAPVRVRLTMTNRSVLPTGALMLQDRLPTSLHGQARFVLDGLAGRETRVVAYQLPTLPRGHYRVGPLSVRLVDPFGMVDITRSFSSTSTVILTPAVERLVDADPGASWEMGETAGSRSIGSRGADDASTREYRQGDDLRKIHWRSTARTGALMVRQEEQPGQAHATVLLDLRDSAHGVVPVLDAGEPDLPATDAGLSSLEWLVSAAASVGTHLLGVSREVGLIEVAGTPVRVSFASADGLIDHLADAAPSRVADIARSATLLRTVPSVIALLGRVDDASLHALCELRRGGPTVPRLAVLVDVDSWTSPTPPSGRSGPGADLRRTELGLRDAGWQVVVARRGDSVAAVWRRLGNAHRDPLSAPAPATPR